MLRHATTDCGARRCAGALAAALLLLPATARAESPQFEQCVLELMRNAAPDVTVVSKHREKAARFESQGFPTLALDSVESALEFDVVVDCTGSASGLPLALRMIRPRGTIIMKTTVAAEHQLSLAAVVIDEISIIGSRCGPFDKAIQALRDKSIDVSNLITHRYPLAAVHDAMKSAVSPTAFKVVFDIQSDS